MSLASESIIEAGVTATRGHLSGNGGLRGHSVGGVFPCVVYASGNIHEAPPVWNFVSPDSEQHTGYSSYEEAESAARIWLEQREV